MKEGTRGPRLWLNTAQLWRERAGGGEALSAQGLRQTEGEAVGELSLVAWVGLRNGDRQWEQVLKTVRDTVSERGSGTEFQDTCLTRSIISNPGCTPELPRASTTTTTAWAPSGEIPF